MAVFNERLVSFILGKEGGWVNNPKDSGKETNRGITIATFNSLCKKVLGLSPTHDIFMKLTHDQVSLFVKWFWDDIKANQFTSQAVAEYITDWNWGSGAEAKIHMQRILYRNFKHTEVAVDGKIGPVTIAAANSIPGRELLDMLCASRLAFYDAIAPEGDKDHEFLKGWKRRATDQYNSIKADA